MRRNDCMVKPNSKNVLFFLEEQILLLKSGNKLGTAMNYRRALNSFSLFLKGKDIAFRHVDEKLVAQYENWLQLRGISRNSSSFYMRVLRSVYNKAVDRCLVIQAFPFRNVYTGVDKTRKRAINEQDIRHLCGLELPPLSPLAFARDLFIFSYCMRGMAFVDMAFLCKRDLNAGYICYVRKKTGKRLAVRIEPCMQEIINRYYKRAEHTQYLFPILSSDDPVVAFSQYQTALGYYNKLLKRLSGMLHWDISLSSYVSRHSWATAARNHNIPIAVISAGMGHATEKTTQIYLASLESSVIDQANQSILVALH